MSDDHAGPRPPEPARPAKPVAAPDPAGLTPARAAMAPAEAQQQRSVRTLEVDGVEWAVALMGRSISGIGDSPGVTLSELVFTAPEGTDVPARMVIRPARALEELSNLELEDAFRVSRPHVPSLVQAGQPGGQARAKRPRNHRRGGGGRPRP